MCCTHTLELERPDHVGGQLLGVRQRDAHHAVRLGPPAGPILKLKRLLCDIMFRGQGGWRRAVLVKNNPGQPPTVRNNYGRSLGGKQSVNIVIL